MTQSIHYLTDELSWFPDPQFALEEPAGLLAIGGDLLPERIVHGYQQGIFPWYSEDEPLMWWSPNPRATFNVNEIKINKSLRKFLVKCDYHVSVNTRFRDVITGCAQPRDLGEGTWILPEMIEAYTAIHQQGNAHSIEVWQWQDERKVLVGGLYGILVGTCFCGESMFSTKPNASKLALIVLSKLLKGQPNAFIDCQLPNPYLMQMGAFLQSRKIFLNNLKISKSSNLSSGLFRPRMLDWRGMLEQRCR